MSELPCQDSELKAKKYRGKSPLKTLEKFGCKKIRSRSVKMCFKGNWREGVR
jgi:hypothetical protein